MNLTKLVKWSGKGGGEENFVNGRAGGKNAKTRTGVRTEDSETRPKGKKIVWGESSTSAVAGESPKVERELKRKNAQIIPFAPQSTSGNSGARKKNNSLTDGTTRVLNGEHQWRLKKLRAHPIRG